jgi:hypothetical protein
VGATIRNILKYDILLFNRRSFSLMLLVVGSMFLEAGQPSHLARRKPHLPPTYTRQFGCQHHHHQHSDSTSHTHSLTHLKNGYSLYETTNTSNLFSTPENLPTTQHFPIPRPILSQPPPTLHKNASKIHRKPNCVASTTHHLKPSAH